ncbi:ligand-binding protein SH3 [Candidatus Woesearchaeota archaeon]|nr:MAG: ligand-binding protein SH3 [Candidatus Woesearchaeota archaeon]
MNLLLIGLVLSALPVFEIRGGLPLIMEYAKSTGEPLMPYFLLAVLINIFAIFIVFFFLDRLNEIFMKVPWYRRIFGVFLKRANKKARKLEKKMGTLGYLALALFVSVPLPGTGAWSGTFVSWILNLDRRKSIFFIALGVILASFFVLAGVSIII